jgi:UDP-N-acetylmuramyl tripeptide synthase
MADRATRSAPGRMTTPSVAAGRAAARSAAAGLAATATRAAAVSTGKAARLASRALHRGGGTTLPGYLAARMDPGLVASLAAGLPNGCVLITGTNGKTTTTRIMAAALRRAGLSVITNPEGSNLIQGIATVLLTHTTGLGRLSVPGSAIGVFEVDEGAFSRAAELLRPRLAVITNLFRDQLDRYFEVDFVASLWQRALRRLPDSATVVLNADDPQVAHLGEDLGVKVAYFGVEDGQHGRPAVEHVADARRCPRCEHDLLYELSFYAHLGHYSCKECGWRRPAPRFAAWRIELDGLNGSRSRITTPAGERTLELPLAGLYNACNALAAAAGACCLGVDPDLVQAGAEHAAPAFGRLEQFRVNGRNAVLVLVKNPIGYNEALRLVLAGRPPRRLLLSLNDNGPDGRDVSWIWDVDLEMCQGRAGYLMVSGQRARDLALRLKYSGSGTAGGWPPVLANDDIVAAFDEAIAATPEGETLYVLATYTALWALRGELVRRGVLAPFWRHSQRLEGAAR